MPTENFEIGADVFCESTACGHLTAVAVKSAPARLAHLIVNPGRGCVAKAPDVGASVCDALTGRIPRSMV